MSELEQLVRRHLADWQTGWSMGAIAEFHQDDGEAAVIDEPGLLMRATKRGGIHIDRTKLADVRAVAYETVSPKRRRCSQALSLRLSEDASRTVLTELGPDDDAEGEDGH